MSKEITLIKNNDKKDWDDLELINEFYEFLQGNLPAGMTLGKGYNPKLSQKKAYSIIWYLQEHFSILPDHIERCDNCGELFDDWRSGLYWETKGKHYCGGCSYLVPENYDRGKK